MSLYRHMLEAFIVLTVLCILISICLDYNDRARRNDEREHRYNPQRCTCTDCTRKLLDSYVLIEDEADLPL